MYALVVCLSAHCSTFDIKVDFVLSREQCLQQAWELRTFTPGTRTVCVSDGNGEILDSAGQMARGWQRGISN